MPKLLCVIPARKGSKRLPNKTMLKLKDKPLIEWTIGQAYKLFNREQIIVNSDYDFISGDMYTHMTRPKELCGDDVPTIDVLKDVLKSYPDCELMVLLQLTSPCRSLETIKTCIKNAYVNKINVRTEDFNGNPDGQVYVWWTNKVWGDWMSVRGHSYSPDINTQLDFEVAEALM